MKHIVTLIFISIILALSVANCGTGSDKNIGEDAVTIDSLFSIAVNSDPQASKRYCDSLMAVAPDSDMYYYELSLRAIAHLALNESDSLDNTFNRVNRYLHGRDPKQSPITLRAMRNICNAKGIAYSYSKMGDSAIIYLRRTIDYELPKRLPFAWMNLADSYVQNGHFVEGAESYRKALQLNDSLGKVVCPYIIYGGLAMSYLQIGEYGEAERYFNKSGEYLDQMNDYDKFLHYNNLGNLKYHKNDYKQALSHFSKSLDYSRSISVKTADCIVPMFNVAEVNILLHQLDSADVYLRQIEAELPVANSPVFNEHFYTLRMAYYTETGDYARAGEMVSRMSDSILPLDLHIIRDKYMQHYYEKTGQFEKAYFMSVHNNRTSDSISEQQVRTRVSGIYLRYKQDTALIAKHNELIIKDEQLHRSRALWISIVVIVFLLAVGTFLLMRRQRERIIARHVDNIARMRMENIRNCLAPHFTFNVINHELASYDADDPHSTNLMSLSKLLRQCVEASSKMTVTLREELEFVSAFIHLECDSWGDSFVGNINVDPDIDPCKVIIPTMFIQIPVENAIKHGLRGIDGERRLDISCHHRNDGLQIVVVNNGLGYKPQMFSSGTGTGMKAIYQTILLLNKRNSHKITFEIGEAYPENSGNQGTRVTIFIPDNFSFAGF
ncbi:MAG: tetratricopeptide repeat protein [Candidatus Limisoma sp.]